MVKPETVIISLEDTWVGVDLDGTLAEYYGWKGEENIGPPVELMKSKVLDLLASGARVKIFTARVCNGPTAVKYIESWCQKHLGRVLEVTNVKDFGMLELWDDRCKQVKINCGTFIGED